MQTTLTFPVSGVSIRLQAEELAAHSPEGQRRPAILLLHGSGGHVESWTQRLAPLLRAAGIGLYAPHYFDRTNTTRADLGMLTDGSHVPRWLDTVDAALAFVASRPSVDSGRIVLAGISLGGFLSLALAARLSSTSNIAAQRRIRAVIDISGGLVPPYEEMATAALPPTLILHGAADNIVPVAMAHRLDALLTQLRVAHRTEIFADEGHWFSAAAQPQLLSAVSNFLEANLPSF